MATPCSRSQAGGQQFLVALYPAETLWQKELKLEDCNDDDLNHPLNQMPRNPSDRKIRRQVEALLTMRGQLDLNSASSSGTAFAIVNGALSLFRELARPAAAVYEIGIDPEDYDELSREELRAMASRAIREGFPLPMDLTDVIANGLDGLNSGGVAWILAPTAGRRGKAPDLLDYAKLRFCMWIRYEHAAGRTVHQARKKVCDHVGHSYEAVSRWPAEMAKLHGKKRMDRLYRAAERLGGRETSTPNPTAAEMLVIFEVRGMLRHGFEDILNEYRAAVSSCSSQAEEAASTE